MISFVKFLVPFVAVVGAFPNHQHQKRARVDTTFNAASQLVDVTSPAHVYQAPGPNDLRGPCPAQNAMANHGYLPRNGQTSFSQCIAANVAVFNFGYDFSIILCFMGQLTGGTLTDPLWSIGNSTYVTGQAATCTTTNTTPGLLGGILTLITNFFGVVGCLLAPITNAWLGTPLGMAQSHLRFEGDASIAKDDWVTVRGIDASTVNLDYFKQLLDRAPAGVNDLSDLTIWHDHKHARLQHSIATNPCYFNAPFAGVLATTAAHAFSARLFGNRSADHVNGVLTKEILSSFNGVTLNPDGSVSRQPFGSERIPNNWYRKATPYFFNDFQVSDFLDFVIAHPEIAAIGGNVNGVNSFAGVDPSDPIQSLLNVEYLSEGDNFACFFYRVVQFGVESYLDQPVGEPLLYLGSTLGEVINGVFAPVVTRTGGIGACPTMTGTGIHQYQQYCGVSRQDGLIL